MKSVICYFSCTGNTALASQELAKVVHADAFRIIPQNPYSAADLDWTDNQSRCTQEHLHPEFRPAYKPLHIGFSQYDCLYLGFPIWWGVAPDIVKTFLDQENLSNIEIFPFGSSYSSPIDEADKQLQDDYPNLNIHGGLRFPTQDSAIRLWVKK